ncbi:MAG: radical SAM protein [Clostridia bacterium]|nr:radical SAM protein [Clostridia bacterium]
MNRAKKKLSTVMVRQAYRYIEKNPMENLPKLVDWAEKIMVKKDYLSTAEMIREIAKDPGNNWNRLIQRYFTELNKKTQRKFLVNFMVNSGMVGNGIIDKNKAKYGVGIPWVILFDPTSACNLKCTGCWAAEYGKNVSLDFSLMDKIIDQGNALGIYMYILSGGDPLVRKDEVLRLIKKHSDCMFLSFTNATLIDEEFASRVEQAGNLAFAISVEGFEEETDMRRGQGTYAKVMNAMDILHRHGIIYGFSTCYHSKNTEVVGSEKWVDYMVEKGCTFGWYFTYIPVGRDAVPDLLAQPEQRAYMYRQVRKFRETKPIYILDFWNDGEYVRGCVAGARDYIHINSNGDVEPCAFIHYSNVNIKDVSLLDALRSPLFAQYQQNQPFSENHLRPCPLLDNPEKLRTMVKNAHAHSTQMEDNEDVDDLTAKCEGISQQWKVTADEIWESSPAGIKARAEAEAKAGAGV